MSDQFRKYKTWLSLKAEGLFWKAVYALKSVYIEIEMIGYCVYVHRNWKQIFERKLVNILQPAVQDMLLDSYFR